MKYTGRQFSKKTAFIRNHPMLSVLSHKLLFALLSIVLLTGILLSTASKTGDHVYRQQASVPKFDKSLLTLLPRNPVKHPLHIKRLASAGINPAAAGPVAFTPQKIKTIYNIPATGGTGTIAIIDAYRTSTIESDLNTFSNTFNLPGCTIANGCLTIHTQSTTPPQQPPAGTHWDVETTIDVEWAHAAAPNAKIFLYEANSDRPNDLITGIDFTRNLPDVRSISMSWGTTEFATEATFESLFTSTNNAVFFAATGDLGTGAFWPAVATNVIAVGGTSLNLNADNSLRSETAWSLSGGGPSAFIPEPAYQVTYAVPNANGKRAIPDVALDADPDVSPYIIIFHGSAGAVGGTSVGTPIWAGLNVLSTNTITHTLLYQNAKNNYAGYYRDITQGTNGTCGTYCTAKAGFDYVTGLGSPIALPQGTAATSQTPTPPPSSTPLPTITPAPNTVIIQNMQFTPSGHAVPIGTTVTWKNNDTIPHTTTSDSQTAAEHWDSGPIAPGQTFSKTFTIPGQYTYHCAIHPMMTGFIEVFRSTSQTPTPISTTPPQTLTPSPTPNGSSVTFSVAVCPHGLGNCGDNPNPNSQGNQTPQHPQRTVTVNAYDSTNTLVAMKQGKITYDPANKNFSGTVDMGNLTNGLYTVWVKMDSFLQRLVPGIQTVTAGQTTTLPLTYLVAGDIDNNNQIDLLDYNILIGCFGSKGTTASCTNKQGADLNDDGSVDGVDYNLFLRELSVQKGQ